MLAAVAVLVLAVSCSEDDGGCEALGPAVAGARMLFDGTEESFARWAHAGPGSFELQEDCTLSTSGGLGLLWYDDEPVEAPATIRVEWRVDGDSNSGVFVGFPAVGDDPFVAVEHGYEVQIDPSDEAGWTTGAIYGVQAADAAAVEDASERGLEHVRDRPRPAGDRGLAERAGRQPVHVRRPGPGRPPARLRRPSEPQRRGRRLVQAGRGLARLGCGRGDLPLRHRRRLHGHAADREPAGRLHGRARDPRGAASARSPRR